ncbi:MAG: FtsW/RodA/SpoVE family cell cycle protein [Campylobacterota bacterium]
MADKYLLYTVTVLLSIGLIFSYSLSTFVTMSLETSQYNFFIKQAVAVFSGLAMMFMLAALDPDKWFNRIGAALFVVFFIVMIAMQFMPASLVPQIGGAKRWINLGVASISPVEFFKVGFVWFLAWSFSRKFSQTKDNRPLGEEFLEVIPYLLVFGVVVVLIAIFQNDFGQVVVLSVTLATMLLFAERSKRLFLIIFALAAAAFTVFIAISEHRIARLRSWWSSIQDLVLDMAPAGLQQHLRVESNQEPYQIGHSLNAIANGEFFGQGLGNGQFKLGYLSEVHTDFVLSGMAEELGFFAVALVAFAFAVVLFRIFKIAARSKNRPYHLFSVGIAMIVGLSFLINAYGISGIAPIKGIAVPFLSYGGSHIWASCIAMGMMLMISKKAIL